MTPGRSIYTVGTRHRSKKEFMDIIRHFEIEPVINAMRCHRRFIGKSLREGGWKVLHIIEKERIWE